MLQKNIDGVSCLKATDPLRGDSLFLTTKSPVAPGTHFVDHELMKGSVDLEVNQWF